MMYDLLLLFVYSRDFYIAGDMSSNTGFPRSAGITAAGYRCGAEKKIKGVSADSSTSTSSIVSPPSPGVGGVGQQRVCVPRSSSPPPPQAPRTPRVCFSQPIARVLPSCLPYIPAAASSSTQISQP